MLYYLSFDEINMKLKIQNRYWIVPNDILNNKELSFKAKGLFAYIQAKPDDWDFSANNIQLQTKDWLDSIKSWLQELENFWLLKRVKTHNEKWQWLIEYTLTERMCINEKKEKPLVENPSTENPSTENPPIKKERTSKQELVIKNNIILSKDNIETEVSEPVEYWNEEINLMQKFLRQSVWVTAFKDTKERFIVKHCYNLMVKIWKEEFSFRLKEILSDPFKQKNCNKLAYLYWELKSFIHSPVVEAKDANRVKHYTI